MGIAFICLGSNIGDKKANFEQAIHLLERVHGVEVLLRSSFYETSSVGGPPQDDYLNAVLKIKVDTSPEELLSILKGIEKDLGREKTRRNYPRIIDLDILLFDDKVMETEDLTIPHKGMHERCFVLKGLSEIAPDVVHPVTGMTASEIYELNRHGVPDGSLL